MLPVVLQVPVHPVLDISILEQPNKGARNERTGHDYFVVSRFFWRGKNGGDDRVIGWQ